MTPHRPTLRSLTLTSGLSPTPNKRVSGFGDFRYSPSRYNNNGGKAHIFINTKKFPAFKLLVFKKEKSSFKEEKGK